MKLLNIFRSKKNTIQNNATVSAAGVALADELQDVMQNTGASENSRWFGVCLTKNAQNVAKTQFILRSKSNPDQQIEEHELIDLFNKPNTSLNFSKLQYLLYVSYIITNDAYIEKTKEGWQVLDPTKVKKKYNQQKTELLGYEVRSASGRTRIVLADNMYNYQGPEGVAYVKKLADLIKMNKVLNDFTNTFYANGGFIGDVFETEATTKEQLQKMKTEYERSYSGISNVNKQLFLPMGVKLLPRNNGNGNKLSHEEKRMNREDIFAAMGVPESVVGITKSGNSRADSESKERVYIVNTIAPEVRMMFDFFNDSIIPDYDPAGDLYVEPVFDIPEDSEQNRSDAVAILGGNGTKPFGTFNEAREKMGLPQMDGLDIMPTEEQGQQITQTLKRKRGIILETSLDALTREILEAKKKVTPHICNHECNHESIQNQDDYTDEELERLKRQVGRRAKRTDSNLNRFVETIAVFNNRQRELVLERVESLFNRIGDQLLDADVEEKLLIELLLPISLDVIEKAGKEEIEALPTATAFDINDPVVQTQLDTYLRPVAKSYVSTTIKTLTEVIESGVSEGRGLLEVKRDLNSAFDFADDVRAKRLAKTVLFANSNQAAYQAFENSGVVKTVKWVNASPCQYCAVLVRRGAVPLGEHYALAGQRLNRIVDGEEVEGAESQRAWMDVKYPPLHPNCECSVVVAEFI